MAVTNYQDLEIWQLAMDLCEMIYKMTSKFPKQEQYGLVAQMRRSVISIPSNISEGFVRRHKKELRQFIAVAIASLAELDTQILLSHRLNYFTSSDVALLREATDRLGRKMTRFLQGIVVI